MIAIPDILNLHPRVDVDQDAVGELLELAFLGKENAKGLDRQLAAFRGDGRGWQLDLFAEDLFVRELIRSCFQIELDGVRFPVNQAYVFNVLSDPPTSLEAVRFRQEILREVEASGELRGGVERLYRELTQLLAMFKQPDHTARLDINVYRLDVFRQAKGIIDWMATGFSASRSGLRRLHRAGVEIQASDEYRTLADLLEYESRLATVRLTVGIGADGDIKHLGIEDVDENRDNRFYRGPWKRLWDRFRLVFRGYSMTRKEVVGRLLCEIYLKISPSLTPLVQLIGQLELYLSALCFRRRVESLGLRVSLARFDANRPFELRKVYNPLLLDGETPPVPCSIRCRRQHAITIVTGPNSGGKTRLLQTVGLTQLLGQSGLYVPAADANLSIIHGLFVSLVESETAGQAEGRLGRELLRIRQLFESMGSPSMVILDELCSGTNPAEGIEIFQMVVRLLDRLETATFISTHFLDFVRELRDEMPVATLEFLQVETDDKLASTYQFGAGVAETSLAAATAQRLGVTFEELSALIDRRQEEEDEAAVG